MKELEIPTKMETTEKFVGQAILKRGHRCWQVEIETGIITPAIFEKEYDMADSDSKSNKKKLLMKEGCLYFNGLNQKSVIKQMNNLLKLQQEKNG